MVARKVPTKKGAARSAALSTAKSKVAKTAAKKPYPFKKGKASAKKLKGGK